jgi:hypothetical protein
VKSRRLQSWFRDRHQHPNFWQTKPRPKPQHPCHAQTPRMRSLSPLGAQSLLSLCRASHGPNTNTCIDFREDPDAEPEELWEPEGASYYNGELILQPRQRWTPEQQLELLDTHPLFTGRCPRCEMTYPQYETPPVHWDCSECGWMDDSV